MGCKQSRQFADQPLPYAIVVDTTKLATGPLEASKATAAPKRGAPVVTKKDVEAWAANDCIGPDPRGPHPDTFHCYFCYEKQAWQRNSGPNGNESCHDGYRPDGGAPNHVDDEFARIKRTRQLVRAADKLDIADAHQEAAIRRIASYLAPEMGITDTTLPAPVIMSLAREGCRWGCDFRVELSGDGNYDVVPVGERGDSTDV